MTVLTPGFSEAIWCTVNANFLSQVIGLGVSVALLQTMRSRLSKLNGSDYDDPVAPQTPADAIKFQEAVADARSNRRWRCAAKTIALLTLIFVVSAIGAWIAINLIVDGNTKCSDIHGKFEGTAPNWVLAFILLAVLAGLGRALFEFAAKGLPEENK